jgi:dihydrofolate reductase
MAKLIYSAITSLDGYVADKSGNFDWAAPDEEVHAFVNELESRAGTYLYGRRIYEVMLAWDDPKMLEDPKGVMRDFAKLWQAADKIVYSRTLMSVSSARTRLEHSLDADAVRKLKSSAIRDLTIGGPELAGEAIKLGLVDEIHLFLHPIIVGGGMRSLPDDALVQLELMDERRFTSGVVHMHYRTAG